jgi:hypothetical protein
MPGRDEFTKTVKDELAARAGHRCSRPGCRAPTSGPSESRSSGSSNAGEAAHIRAASEGGPRYDPAQTPEERRARSNGIWLCGIDAKAIDDEERYTVELLEGWRREAEVFADEVRGRPEAAVASLGNRRLIPFERVLHSEEQAGDDVLSFLDDVGATRTWGRSFEPVRLLLTELVLNSFQHGGVDSVQLATTKGTVTVSDSGPPFESPLLRRSQNGGGLALAYFEERVGGSFTQRPLRSEGRNHWVIVDEVATMGRDLPCTVRLEEARRGAIREFAEEEMARLDGCDELHLYHRAGWSISPWVALLRELLPELSSQRLVIHGVPEGSPLTEVIALRAPNVRFVD